MNQVAQIPIYLLLLLHCLFHGLMGISYDQCTEEKNNTQTCLQLDQHDKLAPVVSYNISFSSRGILEKQ